MANQTINSEDLDGVRAIGVPRAARMYDITKNAMRKMLREAGVLIERGRIHRVLLEDLYRVMEGEITSPAISQPQSTRVVVSDVDRAAFTRASRGRGNA
jgi:hypothetical protein